MESASVTVRSMEARLGDVEIVEHKGIGHPDTLCDGAVEAASRALSRAYLERFGAVLHHNVDKALLIGGRARAALGGGEVLEPLALTIAGRAVDEVGGARLPVREIVVEAARSWLRRCLHAIDVDRDVRVDAVVRPGSADLLALFGRGAPGDVHLANDTSYGVGYAPLSATESGVLAASTRLRDMARSAATPCVGEDIKLMAMRRGLHLDLTVACAMVGRHLPTVEAYVAACDDVAASVSASVKAATHGALDPAVRVNAADDIGAGSLYLTVTGTSAEAGDDGVVGRGNRINGLITPFRPMTLEAAAGKNSVSHVGRLYHLAAHDIARELVAEIAAVARAECFLVGRIGRRIDDPALVDVRVALHDGARIEEVQGRVTEIVRAGIARVPTMWRAVVSGAVRVF